MGTIDETEQFSQQLEQLAPHFRSPDFDSKSEPDNDFLRCRKWAADTWLAS